MNPRHREALLYARVILGAVPLGLLLYFALRPHAHPTLIMLLGLPLGYLWGRAVREREAR